MRVTAKALKVMKSTLSKWCRENGQADLADSLEALHITQGCKWEDEDGLYREACEEHDAAKKRMSEPSPEVIDALFDALTKIKSCGAPEINEVEMQRTKMLYDLDTQITQLKVQWWDKPLEAAIVESLAGAMVECAAGLPESEHIRGITKINAILDDVVEALSKVEYPEYRCRCHRCVGRYARMIVEKKGIHEQIIGFIKLCDEEGNTTDEDAIRIVSDALTQAVDGDWVNILSTDDQTIS